AARGSGSATCPPSALSRAAHARRPYWSSRRRSPKSAAPAARSPGPSSGDAPSLPATRVLQHSTSSAESDGPGASALSFLLGERLRAPVCSTNFGLRTLVAKRMQLLRQLVPAAKRIAMLVNPTDPEGYQTVREVQAAAGEKQILVHEVATDREIDAAFA